MTSRRSWLLGLALGALLSVQGVQNVQAQGVPRTITYQGVLVDGLTPVNGLKTIKITYKDALGTTLLTETFQNVQVINGIFNLSLGSISPTGFPASMDFNQQYFISASIDGGADLSPATSMQSAPYALNAGAVNGIAASKTPTPGDLVPLDANGKFPVSVIPTSGSSLQTINSVPGDANGNVTITAGTPNVSIVNNAAGNNIKISVNAGAAGVSIAAGVREPAFP